jgi:hypothetical protein
MASHTNNGSGSPDLATVLTIDDVLVPTQPGGQQPAGQVGGVVEHDTSHESTH